ncbi:MAG: pirin family protein [Sphingobacteriales bacterium]|nr:pirin family protein [Sphingobacteriales bacterium]
MENSVLHKANTRGHANHGWLDAHHSFSFASYYNPERMQFGALRVLNDDMVSEGQGFGTHPHDNMEIITIPLEGAIEHKDSMGNSSVIRAGEIQVMSSGSGITHSEFNHFSDRKLKLLQIWIFPNKQNVKPRYDQLKLDPVDKQNRLQQILSPVAEEAGVWIHQNAWFHLGKFDKDLIANYQLKDKSNGVYAFVIQGEFMVNNQKLETRDALGIWSIEKLSLSSLRADSEILLIEVPMNV